MFLPLRWARTIGLPIALTRVGERKTPDGVVKALLAAALFGWGAHSPLMAAHSAPPRTPLFDAIREGDADAVRNLAKDSASLNVRDAFGNTPLIAAAAYADARVLGLLLDAGAEVNATNHAGASALLRAATFEDKVGLLVAKGADVRARSRFGNTALILAARRHGNSRTVRLLLDQGVDPNGANMLGATPLMAAAAAADADSILALLDAGADVNARPGMSADGFIWGGGRTPLMWVAFQGDEPLARLLLERGAKVDGFTVGGGPLAQACWGGHPGMARLLLEAGATVDQRDLVANYTPLHWAASSEHASPTLVQLLLARGADVNAEGGQPVDNFLGVTETPLSLARKRGNTPIVQALLEAGAREASALDRTRKADDRSPGAPGAPTVTEAVLRALPPLTKTAEDSVLRYRRHASRQDCVSCHQQQLPLAAISMAHSRQLATDREAARHQLELLNRDFLIGQIKLDDGEHSILETDWEATFHPEPAIFDGYASLNLLLEHQPPSEVTDAMVHQLATLQHADGHWSWNLPRPPIQASDITATASAVHVLENFGIPARHRELTERVHRARAWLAKARPETNEERVHQLLGLAWADEPPAVLQDLATDLIRQQRPDGGWGQLAGLESDAYGTGQSLYALMAGAGKPADDPAVRRGLDFLRRSQLADGTWHVRSRAHPFQPPMDSGFPHGRDGWISSAGSSWAVIALATSLDPSQPPPAVPAVAQKAPAPPPSPTPPVVAVITDATEPVEFARDIQPLFERSCANCHSGERPKGGFALSDRESLLRGGNRGEPAVVPGQPDAGELIRLVQDQVEDLEMPPLAKREKYPALNRTEVAQLSRWIAQGAAWPDTAGTGTPSAPGP